MARGIWVRALVRHAAYTAHLPADDIFHGEVTVPATITGAAEGVDAVLSSVGITRQRDGLTYQDVDFQANCNLLHVAEREGVKTLLYVSLFRGRELRHLKIADAKEHFVDTLRLADLDSVVIRPTAYFSDMADVLALARRGHAFVFGDGATRINPISGRDLAAAVVDALLAGERERNIGGPQVLTHEDIARLAFETLGRPPHIHRLPRWSATGARRVLRALTPVQLYGPVEFFLTVATRDMVAPPHGRDQLADFFRAS